MQSQGGSSHGKNKFPWQRHRGVAACAGLLIIGFAWTLLDEGDRFRPGTLSQPHVFHKLIEANSSLPSHLPDVLKPCNERLRNGTGRAGNTHGGKHAHHGKTRHDAGLPWNSTDVLHGPVPHDEVAERCEGTVHGWCQPFLTQKPIPTKAPPRGNRSCLNYCNGAGICNWDTGLCDCTAGYSGDYCQYRQKRPCTNAWRAHGAEPTTSTRTTDQGWTASRCAGVCDENIAACYCNGTYGRIPPPPEEMPLYADPVQQGRPLTVYCMPKKDDVGAPFSGGAIDNRLLWSEKEGWCMAATPKHRCPCMEDGWGGPLCDVRYEQFCLNQCSGHGDCRLGFCRCHPGYYGHDCARRVQGAPELPGLEETRPWLKADSVPPPAAEDPPRQLTRLRPLIYVYDLPPDYNTRLLQYRNFPQFCTFRKYTDENESLYTMWTYGLETLLHELFLQSLHRTLDPEEADFFYVPVYTSCYAHPIYGWADHPWYYGPSLYRPQHMAMMALEAKRWVENHHPWWQRRGGADHIWLFSHDEASCWVPSEIYNTSIILSHWGRMDPNPESNTTYNADNYSVNEKTPWAREGWTHLYGNHTCYEPERNKDLLLPIFKAPQEVGRSPLLGSPPRERSILLFFRGDFRDNIVAEDYRRYSRFIRQTLRMLSRENKWQDKYNILIGTREDFPGDYDVFLDSSIFCLVAPGDGFSPRAEDAVLHGCIPVVIMDDVEPVLSRVVDWAAFSVRILQKDMPLVPEILLAISEERIREMQTNLAKVWHRFLWSTGPSIRNRLDPYVAKQREGAAPPRDGESECDPLLPQPYMGDYRDDAFSTLLGWLYKRALDRADSGIATV